MIGEKQGNCNNFVRGWTRDAGAGLITGSKAAQAGTMKGYGGMLLDTGVVLPQRKGATLNAAGRFGCVDGTMTLMATAMGVGKRFTINPPTKTTGTANAMVYHNAFFHRPLPGHTIAVSIPNEQKFPQLATSFRIDGPPNVIPLAGDDAPMGLL
ncbi:MAG: hypothetical protein ACREVB_01275, partial [Burkholderiales bacterium]